MKGSLRVIVCGFAILLLNIQFTAWSHAARQQKQLCREKLPQSTPSSHFVIQPGTETVLHKITNLLWQRCLLGQQFQQGQCKGNPVVFSQRQSSGLTPAKDNANLFLEEELKKYPGWRIANEKELLSIVEFRCVFPRLNTEIFPGYSKNFERNHMVHSFKDFTGSRGVYRLVKNNPH